MDDNFNNKRTQQEIDSSTNSKRYRTFAPDSISRNKQLQLDIISQLKYENKGTESRIVSGKWYVQWEGYCLDIQTRPSSVNNSTIMDANNRLKEGLDEGRDYYVVPIEAWRNFIAWYGLIDPSHELSLSKSDINHDQKGTKSITENPIPSPGKIKKIPNKTKNYRKKEEKSTLNSQQILQQFINQPQQAKTKAPMYQFKVYKVGQSTEEGCSFAISASCSVLEFQSTLLDALNIPLSEKDSVKLWLLNNQNTYLLHKLESPSPFVVSDQLLSSSKNRTAHPIDTSTIPTTSSISSCLSQIMPSTNKEFYLAVDFVKKEPTQPASPKLSASSSRKKTLGLTGLQNLGNTCYMNSAIQCLSNTERLTEWFTSLNGELAKAYAALLSDIWKPSTAFTTFMRSSVSPREFKSTFERFNPHFAGYLQQDSQELLSFLLDGLHEDLNRVLQKPYIEIPDFDSQEFSDSEIAYNFWQYHKARNDSIIVDLFQGQYKSRLICDECLKVSVTFDPFMHISVPLPRQAKTSSMYEINLIYVPYLPSQKQRKMKIHVPKEATIEHLQKEIEKDLASLSLTSDNNFSLLVAEIHENKIYKVFDTEELVDLIQPSDQIYVYQLPCSLSDQDWVIFPVYCSKSPSIARTAENDVFPIRQIGVPIVIAMKKSELQDQSNLYTTIVSHIERHCIIKLFEEDTTATRTSLPTQTQLSNGSHSPVHTTAAVTPAGGRPMIPLPNLFQIKVFQCDQKNKKFNFPQGVHVNCQREAKDQHTIVEQGQGVVIEWKLSRAQEAFGASVLCGKIDAWNDFDIPNKDEKKEVNLQDCLHEFASDELLTSQDSWYCPQCKKHQHASKKMDIWKLPEIMIVHLKRFSQFRRWEETKLDTFVDFPLTGLDMSEIVLGPHEHDLIYDLYAVDNHYGGMGGGHYTAFAQNFLNGEWYEFNDTHVTRMEAQDVKTSAAYILFYKRRS